MSSCKVLKDFEDRAFVLQVNEWPQKTKEILVCFLEGPEWKQAWVKKTVLTYLNPLLERLKIKFLPFNQTFPPGQEKIPIKAHVYLRFQKDKGNWAALGNQNKLGKGKTNCNIDSIDAPRTNFKFEGKTYDTSKETFNNNNNEVGGTILHEFCHILALQHEHTNPDKPISYNWEQIYKDVGGPPNNWSKKKVKYNFKMNIETKYINGTEFDPHSIMMYPIKNQWTTNGIGYQGNDKLSELDKKLLKKLYANNHRVPEVGLAFLWEQMKVNSNRNK
eukprot:Pgem_evm4s2